MRRKSLIFTFCALLLCCVAVACGDVDDGSTPAPEVKYTVTYLAGGGTGDAPEEATYNAGTTVTVAQNTFTYTDHEFDGWSFESVKYNPGDSYTVNKDTVFTATWKEKGGTVDPPDPPKPPVVTDSEPSFSQARYTYDKLGGGDLELPFDLDGAGLYYVRLNDEILDGELFEYDTETGAIVVECDYVLDLALGSYTVTAITDSRGGDKQCTVEVVQSLKTSFDPVTEKYFAFGKDEGVTFDVDYNRTTPYKLTQNGVEIPSEYISYDENSITVKSEWVSKSSIGRYKLELSNHDRYEFTVTSNIIFATDYDISTEHSDVRSNTGSNPFYQYYDTVAIVDAPSIMNSGKALKITPNQPGDLHNYITLRTPECSYTWHRVEFKKDKLYYISFDYMTHGTVGGELYFRGADKSTVKKVPMLYGGENDDVVHRFSALYNYDEIGVGVRIYAEFINGGEVYVDNYKIVELDVAPEMGDGEYDASGNYVLNYDAAGYDFDVQIDGESVEYAHNSSAKTVTIAKAVLSALTCGEHKLSVVSLVGTFDKSIRITDDRVAEFADGTVEYRSLSQNEIKVYGSFEETIELVSLKQKEKAYENAFADWNFTRDNDTETNFASEATLTTGLEGNGYITLPKSLLDKFWGEVTFVAEFNNGKSAEFTVNSADVLMYTDYDVSVLKGYFGGAYRPGSPLNSGLWGDSIANTEEREAGNKALYIRSTQGAADTTAFTSRYSAACTYDWFRLYGSAGDCYRVTFDYQISGFGERDVVFRLTFASGEDIGKNYFAEYDGLDGATALRYLIADGKVHTFDSGWFTHSDGYRASKINFPSFTQQDGKFIMFDNYRVTRKAGLSYVLEDLANYKQESGVGNTFTVGVGETVSSISFGETNMPFVQSGATVSLDISALEALECKSYNVRVETNYGVYKKTISVTVADAIVEFAQVTANYSSLNDSEVKLYGSFNDVARLVSLKRKAVAYNNDRDDFYSNYNFAYANDTATNFVSQTTFVKGLDNSGYLSLPKAFLDKFYGTTVFIAEFNNGDTVELTVHCTDVPMFTNYDETTIRAYENGEIRENRVVHSGLSGNSIVNIEEREPGNKAMYIRSTENAEDRAAFTIRFNPHPWTWYNAFVTGDECSRVTFDYQIQGLAQNSVYFMVLTPKSENKQLSFYGDYDTIDTTPSDRDHVVYYLIADGRVHTFDSGWFANNTELRNLKIQLPEFTESDNAFIMFDNYRIVRKSGITNPLAALDTYDTATGSDLTVVLDGNVTYVKIDGNDVEYSYNNGTLSVAAALLNALDYGDHTIAVKTDVGTYRKTFRLVDTESVAEITQTTTEYRSLAQSEIKVYGSFSRSVTLTSLKQKYKDYDNGYADWHFTHGNDTTTNFVSQATLTSGLDGTGYITLPKAFLDKFWGEVTFVAEFSNGKFAEFVVDVVDVLMFTDYDVSSIYGYIFASYDVHSWSPFSSGLNGEIELAERESGNKAFYIRSSVGSADNTMFTIKYTNGVGHDWYRVIGSAGDSYRVTFDYQISGFGERDVVFKLTFADGEDINANYFSDYDDIAGATVMHYLIADGQVHTFDSGWFTHSDAWRLSKIDFPAFEKADGKFMMFDNYRVERTFDMAYILAEVDGYKVNQAEEVTFDADGMTVTSVKLGDTDIAFTQAGNTVTLSKAALGALACDRYVLKVVTNEGTFKKEFAITDERVSTLTQTSANVVRGQTRVKLAGTFDSSLNVISVKRRGGDEWDSSRTTPVDMNKDYVTFDVDGIILSAALIEQAYGTATYYVLFDNGKTVEFTLTSNIIYYSNYDETTIFETNTGNVGTCQDTNMWTIGESGNGNKRLEYRPERATLWHSTNAINGGGQDNGIFTFGVESRIDYWKRYSVPSEGTVMLSFDYEIETNGKSPNFKFRWFGPDGKGAEIKLLDSASGQKGNFYIEIPAGDLHGIMICCPASTPSEVAGCALYIDNYYFGVKQDIPADDRTAYLTQTAANVAYGQTATVKLAGVFDTSLNITSLTRQGTDDWDTSRTEPVAMNKDYVTLSADGLTLSSALVNQAYDTTTYVVTLDNGKQVQFTLTSNLLYYTNYDETRIFDTRGGNMPSCQDAAMWSVVAGEGGNHLEYRPERAVEGHAVSAINGGADDNAIFTYKSPSRTGLNWMDYDFAVGRKMVFFFDYTVENPDNAEHNIIFYVRRKSDGKYIGFKLDGSGRFEQVIDYDIDTIMICCGVSSPDKVKNVCLKMDNFGFGIVD